MNSRKIFTWMLAILPMISFYSLTIGGISLDIGNTILIILTFVGVKTSITKRKAIITKTDKQLLIFLFYTLLVSLINIMLINSSGIDNAAVKFIHIICFFCVIILSRRCVFDLEEAVKAFSTVSIIASIAVIIQFFLYNVAKYSLFIVPEAYRTIITNNISRPSGFFLEPAHFARYCVFPLYLILFKDNSNQKIWKAIILTIAVLVSQSSIGYVAVLAAWISWMIYRTRGKVDSKTIFRVILIGVPVIVAIYIINSKYNVFTYVGEHMLGLDMRTVTSGNVRVFRGYSIWWKESTINQLFGTGFGNVREYIIHNNIRTIFDGRAELGTDYMSALSYILVMDGIVGLLWFLSIIVSMFNRMDISEKMLIVLFMILMISNEEFMASEFLIIWIYLLLMMRKRKEKNYSLIPLKKQSI